MRSFASRREILLLIKSAKKSDHHKNGDCHKKFHDDGQNGSLSDRDSCILRPVPFGGMEAVQDENYPSSFRARVFVCGVVVVVGTSDPICSK